MLDEFFRLSQPLSKLYSRVENSKTDKVWVTSRCGSIPATNRSGALSSITYHQFRRNSDKSEEDIAERPVETKEGERDSTEEL